MKNNRISNAGSGSQQTEKESAFKELSAVLEKAGYQVRREKLKQGHGWKTASGSCRFQEDRLIFVDRKNPLDEQLLFLLSVASKLNLECDKARFSRVIGKGGNA